jgi:carbonic anhydrase/acetyltransferase-like protein (isoleucine patch superfamily)
MAIVRAFAGKRPEIAADAFVAENATLIGDVVVAAGASVWYGAVLRGDVGFIRIGARSNVQDLACIHMTTDLSNTLIAEEVTIGHGAILHGARIDDGALIGMGAVVLDNAEIGAEAIVAAGSVVPPRMVVPAGVLVRGAPARVVRELDAAERQQGRLGAARYLELAGAYRAGG